MMVVVQALMRVAVLEVWNEASWFDQPFWFLLVTFAG